MNRRTLWGLVGVSLLAWPVIASVGLLSYVRWGAPRWFAFIMVGVALAVALVNMWLVWLAEFSDGIMLWRRARRYFGADEPGLAGDLEHARGQCPVDCSGPRDPYHTEGYP